MLTELRKILIYKRIKLGLELSEVALFKKCRPVKCVKSCNASNNGLCFVIKIFYEFSFCLMYRNVSIKILSKEVQFKTSGVGFIIYIYVYSFSLIY